MVKDSNTTVLDASIKMAFKLFDARTALQRNEARQKALLENIPEVITVIDTGGRVKYTSPNIEKWFGWSADDEPGRNRWDRVHPDDLEASRRIFQAVVRGDLAVGTGRFRYRCKDGSYKPVEIRVTNRLDHPLIDGMLMSYHDVTATENAEQELVRQRNLLQTIIDSVSGNIFAKDSEGRYRAINATGASKNGYRADQMLGKTNFELLARGQAEEYQKTDESVLATGEPAEAEEKLDIDGRERYFLVRKTLWRDEGGRTLGVIGVSNDITDRILGQKRIEALQASESTDPTVVSALEDARGRVNTMMVLYNKLYRTDDFQAVSLKDFLGSLVDEIAGLSPGKKVDIETRIADFPLDLPKVQTVGIIVNELLTNAMKYAFRGVPAGQIVVTAELQDQRVTVVVQDNGQGVVPVNPPAQGVGLSLVRMLSESLGGTVRFENHNGTTVVVEFPA